MPAASIVPSVGNGQNYSSIKDLERPFFYHILTFEIAPPPKKMMKVYSSKHSLTESAKDARLMNGSLNRTTSSQINPFGNDDYSESGRSGRSGNPFSDDGNPFSDNESRGGNPFSGRIRGLL